MASGVLEDTIHFVGKPSAYSYGTELVTDPGFDDASAWTVDNSWTVAGGVATATGDGANTQLIGQDFGVVVGTTYRISYQVMSNSLQGSAVLFISSSGSFASTALTSKSGVGSHVVYLQATDAGGAAGEIVFAVSSASTSGSITIDNVSVTVASLGTNMSFETADFTGWTGATGWAAATSAAVHTAGNVGTLANTAAAAAAGTVYRLQYTVSNRTAGTITAAIGGTSGAANTANSTHVEYIKAADTTKLTFTPHTDFDGTLDDIRVEAWFGNADAGGGCTLATFSGTLSDYMGANGEVLHNETINDLDSLSGNLRLTSASTWDTTPVAGTLVYCAFSTTSGIDGVYEILSATVDTIVIDLRISGTTLDDATVEIWIGGAYTSLEDSLGIDATLRESYEIMNFTNGGGGTQLVPAIYDQVTGATSGSLARIRGIVVTSGQWDDNDAAGYFLLSGATGEFQSEQINIDVTKIGDTAAATTKQYFSRHLLTNLPQETDSPLEVPAETSAATVKEQDAHLSIKGFYASFATEDLSAATDQLRIVSDMDEGQPYYGGSLEAFRRDEGFTQVRPDGKWIDIRIVNIGHAIRIVTDVADFSNLKINVEDATAYSAFIAVTAIRDFCTFSNIWFGKMQYPLQDTFNLTQTVLDDCYVGREVDTNSMARFDESLVCCSIFNGTGKAWTMQAVSTGNNSTYEGCLFYKGIRGVIPALETKFLNCTFYGQTTSCVQGLNENASIVLRNTILVPDAAASDFGIELTLGGISAMSSNCLFWGADGSALTTPISHAVLTTNPSLPRGSIVADPQFNNPDNGDFSLRPSSPAIGGGLDDLWGNSGDIGSGGAVVHRSRMRARYE